MRGLERGLELACGSINVAAYVETEAFVVANLVKQMEDGVLAPAVIYTDVKTLETALMASLADIRALENRLSVSGGGYQMNDSFGQILNELSKQVDLFSDSSKTLQTISTNLSHTFLQAYEIWAMQLRQEYSARQKWGQITSENGFLFWQSKTNFFCTPSARDWKDTPGMTAERKDGASRNDQLPRQVFSLHSEEIRSIIGKRPVLNPAWVLQCMGTTLQKTFFAWREMPSLNKQRNLPSEL